MKNKKALAIALSAGLVLGGAFVADTTNVAYAAESRPWTEIEDIAKPIEKESRPWTEIEDIAKPIEKEKKKSIPLTELEPSNPKKLDDDKEVIIPIPVNPSPTPVIPEENKKTEDTTSKEVDDLIKELDDRTEEIQKEMEKIDSTIIDDNQKPAEEDKKPVDDKKPSNEDDDANAQPSKDKVVVKDIIKEVKEAVRVPSASHNNPKTGVADLSAVAGTLAISMAGIVATRKKND